MIDPESIQNHSRMVQGPPGYHKTTLNDSYSIFGVVWSNTAAGLVFFNPKIETSW